MEHAATKEMKDQKDLPIPFLKTFQGKRIFITGHTGFKGAWLAQWLSELGATVSGYSIDIPSNPSLFEILNLEKKIEHNVGDICHLEKLKKVFFQFSPEIVLHLAAQPLVRSSYDHPKLTFDTNVGGTVNVLECIRESKSTQAALIVTTDKCYENINTLQGYRETDRLGGKDPYSASKACTEIVFNAYYHSFFENSGAKIASVRAGNVIGGGDWALDRIIPDCVRAWSENKKVLIRNPNAVRPWQHVLEAIGGYLRVTADLLSPTSVSHGESYNFGPHASSATTVGELITEMKKHWPQAEWEKDENTNATKKESALLHLNWDKAAKLLQWKPLLNMSNTIQWTSEWYRLWAEKNSQETLAAFTLKQIKDYEKLTS